VLLPYPTERAPGQRYRIEQWLRLLPSDAFDTTVHSLTTRASYDAYLQGNSRRRYFDLITSSVGRLRAVLGARRWDAVYVYREAFVVGGPVLEGMLARSGPLIFDFDDAIWLGDSTLEGALGRALRRPTKTAAIVRAADRTIAGNPHLARWATEQGARAATIFSTVEPAVSVVRSPGRPITIGWSGSPTTSRYLAAVEAPLRAVLEQTTAQFVTIGASPYALSLPNKYVAYEWSADRERALLPTFDIGIMPLTDSPWTRGKGGFKLLQYYAHATPVVASPVGANNDIVVPGVTGYFASTEDEWTARLMDLVDSVSTRRRLGAAGRQMLVDRYDALEAAEAFYSVVVEAIEDHRSARAAA
jgi:hypothetical protein